LSTNSDKYKEKIARKPQAIFRIIRQNYVGKKSDGIGSIEISELFLTNEFFSFRWLCIPD